MLDQSSQYGSTSKGRKDSGIRFCTSAADSTGKRSPTNRTVGGLNPSLVKTGIKGGGSMCPVKIEALDNLDTFSMCLFSYSLLRLKNMTGLHDG